MMGKRIVVTALWVVCATSLGGAGIRPAHDMVGFCWESDTMNRLIALLGSRDPLTPARPGWVAAICPHDDYLYAGRIYLPVFTGLQAREVVIIGVTHGRVRRALGNPEGKVILDTHERWTGLKAPVEVSGLRDWLVKRLPESMRMVSDRAHAMEHSIEAMIPFLQYYRSDIRITPIMVTAMSPRRIEAVSRELAVQMAAWMRDRNLKPGRDVVLLISADGNHYGPDFDNAPYGTDYAARSRAERYDRDLIRECLQGVMSRAKLDRLQRNLDPDQTRYAPLWCGRYSIPFGLMTVLNLMEQWSPGDRISGDLLGLSDTWLEGVLPLRRTRLGITAPFSLEHWVSFFSMTFRLQSEG